MPSDLVECVSLLVCGAHEPGLLVWLGDIEMQHRLDSGLPIMIGGKEYGNGHRNG